MKVPLALPVVCLLSLILQVGWSLDNGLGLVPPMGWNTWCTLGACGRDYCDAKEIMDMADAMASNGMKELGYEYINLDDCWADKRAPDGTILPDKDRFPDGLVPVIQYVNSKGFKFGLYTDAGVYTCQQGLRSHKIPGSYGHYEQDARTYAEWGVEYLKMDWCNTQVNHTILDPKIQYPQMTQALNNTGKPIFFGACEWGVEDPWDWMAQYANSWRSGPDHHDNWESTSKIIEINADKGKYAGRGGWNDADFIMAGGEGCMDNTPMVHCPGQTDVEYRTEFTMWCMMSSPLIVSTDIRNMTKSLNGKTIDIRVNGIGNPRNRLVNIFLWSVLLNEDLIKVNQDPLKEGGSRIGSYNCPQGPQYCQIWAKKLHPPGTYAVAMYNSGSNASFIEVELSLLNVKPPATFTNLWTKSSEEVNEKMSAFVEPHEAKVYRVTPVAL